MAGLIVTCARHFEPDACDEIEKILADLGDESAYAKATSMSGIITVETSLDPENAINDVRALIDDEPWVVRYLMRLIPITKWIESKQDQIVLNRKRSMNLKMILLMIHFRQSCRNLLQSC